MNNEMNEKLAQLRVEHDDTPATDVPLGNLYELNKNVMSSVPALTNEELVKKKDEIAKYFISEHTYYMLLCNERKDYTVFRLTSVVSHPTAANEVIECLKERGEITAIDYMENTSAYECWIRRSGLSYMYALFPYDAAVIEC